jgi:hypothetical protein
MFSNIFICGTYSVLLLSDILNNNKNEIADQGLGKWKKGVS